MARIEEVEVLRFFETGPIDKVEAVFNIVSEKMRERSRERGGALPSSRPTRTRGRKLENASDEPVPPEPAV